MTGFTGRGKAKKQDLKPKGKNDLSICTPEAIKKSYDKAKSLNRKNNPKAAVEALENTAELAVGRIGALNRIVLYHKCEMLKLLAALTQLNLVSKPFAAAAYDVLTYAAKCKKGINAATKTVGRVRRSCESAAFQASTGMRSGRGYFGDIAFVSGDDSKGLCRF